MGKTFVVVDSRNVAGQVAAVLGQTLRPSVQGVVDGLGALGFEVGAVEVGLALPRESDRERLTQQYSSNDRYREAVEAHDLGRALVGELHIKGDNAKPQVVEKMVDGLCIVSVTREVERIANGTSEFTSIVVLSKDIDLTPALDYAVERGVPIRVGAVDVVQRRRHPYVLLPPQVLAGLVEMKSGHPLERRQLAALALVEGTTMSWSVQQTANGLRLRHSCGLIGVSHEVDARLAGSCVRLVAVGVDFSVKGLEGFPTLVLGAHRDQVPVDVVTVQGRRGPQGIVVRGDTRQLSLPPGGIVAGGRAVVDRMSGRAIAALPSETSGFDPDQPMVVTVKAALPKGGYLVTDPMGTRGLMPAPRTTVLSIGDRVPALQVDAADKGPVWVMLGSPLP